MKSMYRSIDAPWNEDDPRDVERILKSQSEWWNTFSDDECGWIPLRPPGHRQAYAPIPTSITIPKINKVYPDL